MPIATNPKTGETVFLDSDGQWKPAQTAVNPQTYEAVAFDGEGWKSLPSSKGVFEYIDDAVRALAQGATLGFADEFAAKMEELVGRGTYEENLAKQRARDKAIPSAISVPGEIAGAVAGTVAAAPIAAAAIPARVAAASKAFPEFLRFFGLGAAEGALAGAGHAEGSRIEGSAKGAALGGAVGAVAPSVVRGVSAAARGIRGALAPETGAAADIGRALVRDETTPQAAVAKITALQTERPGVATIADVGGENIRGLVERVAQTPGAGRTQVIPALTERQSQQAARISDDLKALTGTNKTAVQTIEETMAARAKEAAPLYKTAMEFEAKNIPEIVNAFSQAVSTGWGQAIAKSPSFRKTLETEYGVTDAVVGKIPLMPLIDAWKKEVDGVVGEAIRRGNKREASVLSKMRDDVIEVVDRHNPSYRIARAAWEGKSKYLDAVEDGRAILGRNISAEELAPRFAALSEAEKEAYRIGAVSSIVNRMGSDPAKLADMTKYLRSPEMTKKIASIMPTKDTALSWLKRLQFEVSSSELTARALGNSATARRLAEREDAQGIVGDLIKDAVLRGPSSLSFLNSVLTAGPKWLRDSLRSRTDKILADLLVNPSRARDLPGIIQRVKIPQPGAAGSIAPAAATASAVNVLQ